MEKKLEEMSVVELKARLFDIDQNIKQLQYNYRTIGSRLENKIKIGAIKKDDTGEIK